MERAHRYAFELTKSSIDVDGDVESLPLRPTTYKSSCNAGLDRCAESSKLAVKWAHAC